MRDMRLVPMLACDEFEAIGLLTARVAMGRGYSVEIQRSGPCSLSLPYRRWHVLTFYPSGGIDRRAGPGGIREHESGAPSLGLFTATEWARISWPAPTVAMHLHLDPQLLQRFAPPSRSGLQLWPHTERESGDTILKSLTDGLYQEVQSHSRSVGRQIDAIVDLICARIASVYCGIRQAPLSPQIGLATLEDVLAEMHGPPVAHATVKRLAAKCSLSTSHFTRQFYRRFGATPHDYMIRSRLELAKCQIYRGDGSLAEIAVSAGFVDQSHMTNTFRARIGLRPSQYAAIFGR